MENEIISFFKEYIDALEITETLKALLLNSKQGDYDFYLYYPLLFNNAFPQIDNEKLKLLSISGYLYFLHLTILDEIFDAKTNNLIENIEVASFCQEEAIKILVHLFDRESKFWNYWYKRKETFYKAIIKEKRMYCKTEKDYLYLSHTKSELGKCAIDGLYILNDCSNTDEYKNLLVSHDYFSEASQIIDDIQDMINDYENSQNNWILEITKKSLKNKYIVINSISLKREIYSAGIALKYYKKADNLFNKSLNFGKLTSAESWCKMIENQKLKNENRIDTLYGFNEIVKLKLRLKNKALINKKKALLDVKIIDTHIKDSLLFLLNEHCEDYIDLKHFMYLSSAEGFNNKKSIHIGETFQLSIVTDILLDLQKILRINLNTIINQNINVIINNRLKQGVRGWSYFPSVIEIAPDIDDLGQIMQMLYKSNNTKYLQDECFPLVDFVKENCIQKDGGILTWLIPIENQNSIQKIQKKFNVEKWGEGPDVEAVANLIYSLQLLNNKSYDNLVCNSISYILKKQAKQGYWESRWYFGKYYGTYVSVRCLMEDKGENHLNSIIHASKFIIETQNNDGGWGLNNNSSDPLNTAFCILTLKIIDDKKFKTTINKAKKFLNNIRKENNSWEAVNFIKPRINDAYRSSTLTTAYVLKALV